MSSNSSTTPLLQQPTVVEPHKPHIPYRDSGAAGKYIFGQPPSWTYKPLPPFPFEKVDEPSAKAHEDDCDSMTTQVGEDKTQSETKKESKITKAVKNLSKRFSTTISKT